RSGTRLPMRSGRPVISRLQWTASRSSRSAAAAVMFRVAVPKPSFRACRNRRRAGPPGDRRGGGRSDAATASRFEQTSRFMAGSIETRGIGTAGSGWTASRGGRRRRRGRLLLLLLLLLGLLPQVRLGAGLPEHAQHEQADGDAQEEPAEALME